MVGPALHAHQRVGLTEGGRGGGLTKVCYLLEDKERREGSGNVQFDQIQAGLSVCHRHSFCNKQHVQDHAWAWPRGSVLPLSLSLTELVSL